MHFNEFLTACGGRVGERPITPETLEITRNLLSSHNDLVIVFPVDTTEKYLPCGMLLMISV